jgi:very-short-patch-repair endonuclease
MADTISLQGNSFGIQVERATKSCRTCGNAFMRPKKYSDAQWAKATGCSRRCGAWNLGLTSDDPRIAALAASVAITSKGRTAWNKGLTKSTDARVAAYAAKVGPAQKGRKPNENQLSALKLGHGLRGKKNPAQSARLIARHLANPNLHPNAILARKTKGHGMTFIEKILGEILTELGIEAKFNFRVGSKWIDFAIVERRLAIEADGEFWHQDAAADAARDRYLIALGWRVLHLSGSMLCKQMPRCKHLVTEFIKDHG